MNTPRKHAVIAGERIETGQWLAVTNPFDGSVVAEVPICGAEQVDQACASAQATFLRRDLPQYRRAEILEKAALLVAERMDELTRIIVTEAGKPKSSARGEVSRCIDTLRFAAVEARQLCGEMLPMQASRSGGDKLGFALRVPIGVIGAITPFNFPLNLVAHKVAPAIAAGCPVVLKPAPQAPLSSFALVELLVEAGLPSDWISVVTDSRAEAGGPLVEHEVPAMITFTGSAPVGWAIKAAAPKKRVSLELGSNAPVILGPDFTDLASLAPRIVRAGFGYAGQSCISVQRVIVPADREQDVVEALTAAAADLPVGDPMRDETFVGPLIDEGAANRVAAWLDEARDKGAEVLGGQRLDGALMRPAIVSGAPSGTRIRDAEVFGPVVVTIPYDSFSDAVAIANDSDFGLHAGVFTNDLHTALQAVRALEFGGVLINEVPTYRADQQPYGGERDAGNTREGPRYVVEEMTHLRFVSLQTAI